MDNSLTAHVIEPVALKAHHSWALFELKAEHVNVKLCGLRDIGGANVDVIDTSYRHVEFLVSWSHISLVFRQQQRGGHRTATRCGDSHFGIPRDLSRATLLTYLRHCLMSETKTMQATGAQLTTVRVHW
jgi:hypothetical protein